VADESEDENGGNGVPERRRLSRLGSDRRALVVVSALIGFIIGALVMFLATGAPEKVRASADERRCRDMVQGKMAWNYAGDTDWDASALSRLCKGTTRPAQPPLCFDLVFHGRVDKGDGGQWRWQRAAALCAGTDDARGRVQCFKNAVGRGTDFRDAIEWCNPAREVAGRTTCDKLVQGNIAWNADSETNWSQRKLDLLCGTTTRPTQPLLCFDRLFHGKGDWASLIAGEWRRAAQLCSGTNSADQRVACVTSELASQRDGELRIIDMSEDASKPPEDSPESLFQGVLQACAAPEKPDSSAECRTFVQGNIPWSGAGYNTWQDAVLDKLCANATAPREPGLCFNRAMYGGLDIGETSMSKWAHAVKLCAGTSDATARLACYRSERDAGKTDQQAIRACKQKPET